MNFTYFKFKNFKGIKEEKLDLSKNPDSKVFSLVGLNESGKTTILEAINYFAHKPESLNALQLESYEVSDIHDLIPINKRDNFNDSIVIEAEVELDDDDKLEIKIALKKEADINMRLCDSKVVFTQTYHFKNSIHQPEKNLRTWNYNISGTKGNGKVVKRIKDNDSMIANAVIKKRMPSILYFPNFLFEFPERIYFNSLDLKHQFFQVIMQDVLDSLDNNTNVIEHIVKRIESPEKNDERNLTSLIGKMQKQLSDVIFTKWNQIFDKQISRKEVILLTGKDDQGVYIEFNIKDDVDTYRISERSLGFRWFFVYILLTQFRSFRKKLNNAFFLFDEPASNLHPSAQSQLLQSFEKLPKVLYTTHSHYLINPKWLENTFVIKNEAIDYDNEEEFNSSNTDVKIHKYREFAVKHPNQFSYFQPILEVLDYKPANLELVPKVVIVEGKNDFYMYNYIQEIIAKSKYNLKIVPGTSANNLETLISLYLGWGINFLVLLDSDHQGLKQKKRYLEIFGMSMVDKIITYSDIEETWEKFKGENMFSDSEILFIQTSCYPEQNKFDKKLFNRSLQELYLKNENLSLSKETLEKFNTVFKSLKLKLNET